MMNTRKFPNKKPAHLFGPFRTYQAKKSQKLGLSDVEGL